MAGTTLLGNDTGQVLHLALCPAESTNTLLDELAGTLVLWFGKVGNVKSRSASGPAVLIKDGARCENEETAARGPMARAQELWPSLQLSIEKMGSCVKSAPVCMLGARHRRCEESHHGGRLEDDICRRAMLPG